MLGRKPWRDAATLIIAATRGNFLRGKAGTVDSDSGKHGSPNYDYNILMLERSSKSSFMPSAEVFPGGVIDVADTSLEWLKLFRDFGYPEQSFKCLERTSKAAPALYENYREKTILAPEIAFRICAIRETFEEAGVLLTRDASKGDWSQLHSGNSQGCFHNALHGKEILCWQEKVQNDANNFIQLCRELNCVPDVWSLFEWTEWLTPITGKKRFDAVFYISSLPTMAQTYSNETEAVRVHWTTPKSVLDSFAAKKCRLEPPQHLEISRLLQYDSLEKLRLFYAARESKGVVRYTPSFRSFNDGVLVILPGDHLYPTVKDHELGIGADKTGFFPPLEISVDHMIKEAEKGLPLNRTLYGTDRKPFGFINNFDVHGHRKVVWLPEKYASAKL